MKLFSIDVTSATAEAVGPRSGDAPNMEHGPSPKKLAAPEIRSRVEAAVSAIGAYDPEADWRLEPGEHAKRYREAAPALARLLEEDKAVINAAEAYGVLDTRAKKAKCRYEFAMSWVALFSLLFALVAMFVSVVPAELGPVLRWGVAFVLGFFLAEFLIITCRRYERPIDRYKNTVRLGLPILAVAVQSIYPLIPASLGDQVENLRNGSILFLVLMLGVADTNSGGFVAWVYNLIRRPQPIVAHGIKVDISHLPLKQQWYEVRGHAEALRRRYFMAIARSTTIQDDSLPSLKLEYIRRHHIEVQQRYYEKLMKESLQDATLPEFLRKVTSGVLIAAVIFLWLLFLALESEQSGHNATLPVGASSQLLEFTRSGAGDLAVLFSLFAVGIYCYSQLTTAILQKRAAHDRFANAWAQLRRATSSNPGVSELALTLPLSEARRSAASGSLAAVVDLTRLVNRLLAAEFGVWSPRSRFKIGFETVNGRSVPRLTSTARLSPDNDFEWIARELEASEMSIQHARKTSWIRAQQAAGGERVEAHGNDGHQSTATAQSGDLIVTKVDRHGRDILNAEGRLDQYVIAPDRFQQLYLRDPADPEGLYRPTERVVDLLAFEGGIDIIAAWGGHQQIAAGYLVRNGDDVYGIDTASFIETYELVDASRPA